MSADVSRHSIKSTLRLASLLSIASWLFSACGASSSVGVSGTALSPKFTVAPHFQPTYSEHDGLETLGDPISPEKLDGGIYYQYFQNGRLEFNGAAADGAQVSLSPLVLEIRKPDPPNTGSPSARALCFAETGHCVNHAFRPYFEKYGGVYYFGYPITDMKVEDGRVVQYFERAMFVWDETLPPDHQVRLAAVGIWKCAIVNCTAVDSASPATPPPDSTQTVMEIVPAIGAFVSHYGGADVFGIPISEPQKLADGTIEQYYENVIFVADSTAPEGVRLRPLGQEFKNGPDPAVAPSSDPDAVFEPATGHNIVNPFRQFYDEHGGYIVFGHPIGEMQIKGGILVQYFENARMEWHGGAPKGLEMRFTNYGR
ncbi:MAG: hypothetical protein HY023_15690, partial [Chloroflexi bacterium]|nr:hypothetical protein [Chloroflexota bacterium]